MSLAQISIYLPHISAVSKPLMKSLYVTTKFTQNFLTSTVFR